LIVWSVIFFDCEKIDSIWKSLVGIVEHSCFRVGRLYYYAVEPALNELDDLRCSHIGPLKSLEAIVSRFQNARMAILSYYVAQSLDGFIADSNSSVDWLESFQPGSLAWTKTQDQYRPEPLFCYKEYLGQVDAVVFGRKTYDFLVRYGSNPYAPLESWVISSSLKPTDAHLPGVSLSSSVSPDAMAFLTRLKERHPRRVWLVGGGHIAKQALLADLLDEMVLTIIPKCIGAGVPLFQGQIALEKNWALIQAGATENGAAQLLYRRRPG
jgi:dihydrofolate reductase